MKKRRGVSLGTLVMLLVTAAVLCGFFLLLPSLTGSQDIRLDAAKLAVAIDQSLEQFAVSAGNLVSGPQNTALPPSILSTSAPSGGGEAQSQPVPTATPVPKARFSLCASGSVIWNSAVRKALVKNKEPAYDILTDSLSGAMSADVSIVTLEHTLIDANKLSDVNQPSQMLSALRSAGINTVSMGHPSILNAGMDGLRQTQAAIQAAGLLPFGAYASAQERAQGVLIERQGVRIGLLHYQDELSGTGRKQTSAEERSIALAPLSLPDMQADIAAIKNAGAQVVLVSLCWGKTGASAPTDEQKVMAQGLADAGADVILGTHSGVLQPVQVLSGNRGDGRYHPVLCAYSLGNLFTYDRESRSKLASILLRAEVEYDPATGCVAFEELSYLPTYAWRGKQNGQTLYRILFNDGQTYPDFVNKDQKSVMERCYKLVTDVMADTGISQAK